MKKLTIIYVLLIFFSCSSSKNYKLIEDKYNHLIGGQGEVTGNGAGSRLYVEFYYYFDKLSIKEKEKFALEGGVVPKIYSSIYFIDKNEKERLIKIFKLNLMDHRCLEYQVGCGLNKGQVNIEVLWELDRLIRRRSRENFSQYNLELIVKNRKRLEMVKKEKMSSKDEDVFHFVFLKKIENAKKLKEWSLKELKELRDTLTNIALNSSKSSKELLWHIDYLKKESLKNE